jgi:Holliday junction DNA helicase RuvB
MNTTNDNNQDFRPKTFADVTGQDDIKEYLKINISAFKKNRTAIGHILFLGFSGVGKTTLATVMANEMGVGFHSVMATRIKTWDDFYTLLKKVEENDVLFIDEIHALNPKIQEHLYGVMEDFTCTIADKNLQQPFVRRLPKFTLIGATTHAGELNAPLLSRFQYKCNLLPYTVDQLTDMVISAGQRIYKINVPKDIANRIAKLSRRTARNCYNLLKAYMVVVEANYPGKIQSHMLSEELLYKTLKYLQIDPIVGLDNVSRKYLITLLRDTSPIGSKTLATMTHEQESTLLHTIEPFLLSDIELEYLTKDGTKKIVGPFAKITKKGRWYTENAVKYVKLCNTLKQNGWFANESLDI